MIDTTEKFTTSVIDEKKWMEMLHDLRSPLMSMKAGIDLLRSSVKKKISNSESELKILSHMENSLTQLEEASNKIRQVVLTASAGEKK